MRTVQMRRGAVPYPWLGVCAAHDRALPPGPPDIHKSSQEAPEMGDVIYVVLVIATFAVLALVVKGVERLER